MFNPLNTNYTWLGKILAAFHLRVSFSQIYKIKQTKPNPTTTTTTTSYYSRGSSFGDYLLISSLSLSKTPLPSLSSPLIWLAIHGFQEEEKVRRSPKEIRRHKHLNFKILSWIFGLRSLSLLLLFSLYTVLSLSFFDSDCMKYEIGRKDNSF